MYIICFYWQGDRWQDNSYKEKKEHKNLQQHHLDRIGRIDNKLAARYVNNLYRGVKRFTDRTIEFVCFTNENIKVESGIELRKLPMHTVSGVLPRLYMFSKEAWLKGQVLCLDLDVVIVGSLYPLLDYKRLFCARSKFKPGEGHKLDGDIMSFRAGDKIEEMVWKPFVNNIKKVEQETKGRERYWMRATVGEKADRWDKVAPGRVVSYKWHIKNGVIPKEASIVSCHGYPRPHQIKENWIKDYWI